MAIGDGEEPQKPTISTFLQDNPNYGEYRDFGEDFTSGVDEEGIIDDSEEALKRITKFNFSGLSFKDYVNQI